MVTNAYRCAMDAYAADPDNFDPAPFMAELNKLESRGYTTAFFDGNLGADAHDYETTRSTSDWHVAGVVTATDSEKITLELRNEIRAGTEITFVVPGQISGVTISLPQIINAKNGDALPKMSAGQHNSIVIPRSWISPELWEKIVKAYSRDC